MKKFLAIILSLVLVFTLVAFVACDNSTEPGGGKFHEVDLTNQDTREAFVNALAEQVNVEKQFGDPTQQGWTYGLEQSESSKFDFDVEYAMAGTTVGSYTAKGNVELNQLTQATVKNDGSQATEFAVFEKIGLKGNIELSDSIYALLNVLNQQIEIEGFDLAATVKSAITNFNYEVSAYADRQVALAEISEGLYGKLPTFVTELLGSRKLKFDLTKLLGIATYATEESKGGLEPNPEDVKKVINTVIDEVLLQYKISVSVATKNGYALRLTATKQSVLAVLNEVLEGVKDPALVASIKSAIGNDTKFELTVRIDEEGAFSSLELASQLSLNLNVASVEIGTIKGKVSVGNSFKISKFEGTISKPNDSDYQIPTFMK